MKGRISVGHEGLAARHLQARLFQILCGALTALGVVVLTALSWKKSRLRVRVLGLMPPLLPLGALLWATLME